MRKLILLALGAIIVTLTMPRCASIGSISGGPKDTIPPVLLSSKPAMYEKNFSNKVIQLNFDEYIALKDPSKQFFVSPPLEKPAYPLPKGKSVIVKLEDTLAPKTTYTFGFGNSIVDNNEGNELKNFQLVFSTGDNLDTLAVEGRIVDAFKQNVPEGVKVMLYTSQNDSVPFLQNPSYYAYANKDGFFRVPNVPAGSYKLVAIQDNNDNLKYDQASELVGFSSTPVQAAVRSRVDSLANDSTATNLPLLSMFKEPAVNLSLTNIERIKADQIKVVFSKQSPTLPTLKIEGYSGNPFVAEPSTKIDSIIFWVMDKELIHRDSLPVTITYARTNMNKVLEDTTELHELVFETPKARTRRKKDEEKTPGFNPTFEGNIKDGVIPTAKLLLQLPSPPLSVDSSKISLMAKTAKDSIPHPFNLKPTANPREFNFVTTWKDSTTYYYRFLPGAFQNAEAVENDTITGKLHLAEKEQFGTFIFKIKNVPNPIILQLLSEKGTLVTELPITSDATDTLTYIPAGKYEIKIVSDVNGNGVWDTGNLIKNIQPEAVRFYMPLPNKPTLIIKANWENEIQLDIKKILSN